MSAQKTPAALTARSHANQADRLDNLPTDAKQRSRLDGFHAYAGIEDHGAVLLNHNAWARNSPSQPRG
jgi:hypothetical protein